MKILWSPQALEDMENIYNFHLSTEARIAANVYNEILEEVKILSKFPQIASLEKLLSSHPIPFRSLIVQNGKYRVTYYIYHKYIIIAAVSSCSQSPEILIQKFF